MRMYLFVLTIFCSPILLAETMYEDIDFDSRFNDYAPKAQIKPTPRSTASKTNHKFTSKKSNTARSPTRKGSYAETKSKNNKYVDQEPTDQVQPASVDSTQADFDDGVIEEIPQEQLQVHDPKAGQNSEPRAPQEEIGVSLRKASKKRSR